MGEERGGSVAAYGLRELRDVGAVVCGASGGVGEVGKGGGSKNKNGVVEEEEEEELRVWDSLDSRLFKVSVLVWRDHMFICALQEPGASAAAGLAQTFQSQCLRLLS